MGQYGLSTQSLMNSGGKDPDDLHGDAPVAQLIITVRRNGAMSVEGCIEELVYAKAMLDAAKDSLNNYHARKQIHRGGLLIPGNETPRIEL